MMYGSISRALPGPLRRYLLHFEALIEDATAAFANSVPQGSRVLDAGAGELQYAHLFSRHRYTAVDLAVGDAAWDYSKLSCLGDLAKLPFRDGAFDACVNIVTLEHVTEPARVISELGRTLKPGGKLFLVVPLEWEEHQTPHDYFRYTRYGVNYLLSQAGFTDIHIQPGGGFFRLLSRRLLNGLQFFPGILFVVAAIFLVPPALVLPLFDSLDQKKNFTLGFICTASKES
jgi:SAM-dependent methyltransferase